MIDPIAKLLGAWALELNIYTVILRLALTLILSAILGCERSSKRHAAGLRTFMVVALSTTVAMILDLYLMGSGAFGFCLISAAAIIGLAIITVNSILYSSRNQIKGLTTAAGLWTAAGVGLALGIGFYEAAPLGGFAAFTVMTLLQRMDNRMHRATKRVDVCFELESKLSLADFMRQVREQTGLELSGVERESGTGEAGTRCYTATLKSARRCDHVELMDKLREIPGVIWVEEL